MMCRICFAELRRLQHCNRMTQRKLRLVDHCQTHCHYSRDGLGWDISLTDLEGCDQLRILELGPKLKIPRSELLFTERFEGFPFARDFPFPLQGISLSRALWVVFPLPPAVMPLLVGAARFLRAFSGHVSRGGVKLHATSLSRRTLDRNALLIAGLLFSWSWRACPQRLVRLTKLFGIVRGIAPRRRGATALPTHPFTTERRPGTKPHIQLYFLSVEQDREGSPLRKKETGASREV